MANAKTYNDLNQATEVNDTDKLALAQSGKQELVTATVGQVAQKVANIVSTDQVTEIVTDLGMGKQIMAQKLQDKGLDVTAADTLTAMANKVDTLDVVGAKEYEISNIIRSENNSYAIGKYGRRIPLTKYYICFTSTSSPYTIGLYGPNADETAMELKSSLVLTDMTSFANPSNLYWTFCSNPKYVLLSNNKQQFMLEISNSAELSLKWTHSLSDSSIPILISRDGEKYVTRASSINYVRDNTGSVIKSNSWSSTQGANLFELYMDDDNTNFFGANIDTSNKSYSGNIDWNSGIMSITEHGPGTSMFQQEYGIVCIDIKNKKAITISQYTSSQPDPYIYVRDITTGILEYSMPLHTRRYILSGSTYKYTCGCLEYDKDDNPLVYTNIGCFKYDILKKSISVEGTSNIYRQKLLLTPEIISSASNSTDNNGYMGGFFLNNRIQFLSIGSTSRDFQYLKVPTTSNGVPVYYNKQICTGLIYKRNAQEVLFTIYSWSDADYESGAYDVDNTKAEVEI